MRLFFTLLTLLAFSFSAYTQENNRLSVSDLEVVKDDTAEIDIFYYEDSLYTGMTIDFLPEKQVTVQTNYKDGKRHGKQVGMYENWETARKYHYHEGQLHGPQVKYNKQGVKYLEENYVHGKLHGKQYYRYENGRTKMMVEYEMGVKKNSVEFAPDGSVLRSF